MTEWQVVGIIVVLVGLVGSIIAPIIRLNSTITRLSVVIDQSILRMDALEKTAVEIQQHSTESHRRIHDRIDRQEAQLHDHDKRITTLEERTEKIS